MPEDFKSRIRNKVLSQTKKEGEPKSNFLPDLFSGASGIEDSFKQYGAYNYALQRKLIDITGAPGKQMYGGLNKLGSNPIEGSLEIGNSLMSLVATPFGVADALVRELPGGNTIADFVASPFETTALGVVEGQKAITKGLESIGYPKPDKEKEILSAISFQQGLNLTPKQIGDIQESLSEFNQGASQFLLGGVAGKLGGGIKSKLGIENVPELKAIKEAPKDVKQTIEVGDVGLDKITDLPKTDIATELKNNWLKAKEEALSKTGGIEKRTDKNNKEYYFDTTTKKRTSKTEFDKQIEEAKIVEEPVKLKETPLAEEPTNFNEVKTKVESQGLVIDGDKLSPQTVKGVTKDYVSVSTPDKKVTKLVEVSKLDEELAKFPKSEGEPFIPSKPEDIRKAFDENKPDIKISEIKDTTPVTNTVEQIKKAQEIVGKDVFEKVATEISQGKEPLMQGMKVEELANKIVKEGKLPDEYGFGKPEKAESKKEYQRYEVGEDEAYIGTRTEKAFNPYSDKVIDLQEDLIKNPELKKIASEIREVTKGFNKDQMESLQASINLTEGRRVEGSRSTVYDTNGFTTILEDAKKIKQNKFDIGEKLDARNKTPQKPEFGTENKIFTKEKLIEGQKYQQENLGKLSANPFTDPKAVKALIDIGGYYFEGGLRKFPEWSKKMIEEVGDGIKPHLLKIWGKLQTEGKTAIKEAGEKERVKTTPFGEGMQDILKKSREQIKQEYREVIKEKEKISTKAKGLVKDVQGVKKIAKDVLEPITTSVEKVSKEVFRKFRQFGFSYQTKLLGRHKAVGNYLEAKSKAKLSSDVSADLNISLMNGWFDDAMKIAKENKFDKELQTVLDMKDALAKDLGVKTIENHFPRMVEDFDGFVKFLEEKFPDYYRDNFSRMITEKANKIGRELTTEERANLINNALRGYNPGITLSDVGNMKKRVIQTLDGELAKYYHSPDASLLQYINQMTELAEARRFFGKQGFDVMDSVGKYIDDLRQGGKLNLEGSRELMEVFKARFNQRGITNKGIEVLRDVGVITKLGNPYSTVTQLKDLAYSMYFDPLGTPVELAKIIKNKVTGKQPKWQIEELGIDPLKIAEELASPKKRAKIVQGFLDVSGFSKLDMLGKETLINTLWEKYTKQAKETKLNTEFERRVERYFGKGAEKTKVLEDLRSGKKTDSTAFLLYNELVGAQPISLLEMPRAYLRGGNWRIAYFLKTFSVRQLDFFLNETVRVMKDKTLPKEQRKQGAYNLMKLTTSLALVGATVDQVRSYVMSAITGEKKKETITDDILDNLMNVTLLSKYDYTKARQNGIDEALGSKLLPPMDFISDPLIYDLPNLLSEKGKALKSTKHIPYIGKFLYEYIKKKKNKFNY